jgi:hypothetical protein
MNTTNAPSGAPAAPRETLDEALRDRGIWLLFALGFATGAPATWGWYELVAWPGYTRIEWWIWLPLTQLGVVSIAAFIVAPFLDLRPALFFRKLGHRRSWVATWLSGALVLMLSVAAVGALLSHRVALGTAAIQGIIAMPVVAALWIAIDALRIEIRPGRGQAYAVTAQYVGALLASAIVSRFGGDGGESALKVAALTLFLAAGLAAVLLLRSGHDAPGVEAAAASRWANLQYIGGILAGPWAGFFARHGRASGLLLAAVALYALGGGVAEHLGKNGHLYDILDPARPDADSDRHTQASQFVTPFELVISLLGAVTAMVAARRLAPAKAFALLQYATIALIGCFLACKLVFGFTVIAVGLLYAARTLFIAFAIITYAVVAARLTARPHTAGQYAMLGLFVSLFWLSETGLNWIGPILGSYAAAGAGVAASFGAIVCMRIASRVQPRAGD